METLKIGLIGAGRIGQVHAQSIAYSIPEASIIRIADVNAAAAQALAEKYHITAHSGDAMDVINDPAVQAVLICSPTPTHSDLAIATANAGKHIFCEKPVDLTIAKILAVKAAVERAGVAFQVGFNRRFDHNHGRVRTLAASGALGKVEIVKITSRDPAPPSPEYARSSGGLFVDMMIHDFDMAQFLADSDAIEVYALATCLVDPGIGEAGDVDTAIVTLKMANGTLAVIDNSRRAAYGYDQRVEVFGELGMATGENDADSTVRLFTAGGVTSDQPPYFFLERYMASFIAEMKQFVAAATTCAEVPVGIHAGLTSVAIAIAAKRSWQEDRPVRVAEILEA